ncbi:hypothetical protein L1049_000769 [Liquidambar formosana]|uniref:Uncharacterized protein n=1 Tax=Liquidambar formosana TaxID=63359 RepID=A0AAP0NBK6_LIQFO
MAAAILRPQDFHKLRFHPESLVSPPFKPRRNPNPNSNTSRSYRRKRSSIGFRDNVRDRDGDRVRDRSMVVKFPAKNLVMEQVTILKRGEGLKPAKTVRFEDEEDLVLCSTDRLGPDPETVQKQIRVSDYKTVGGVYAGSAFFASPPPSSVPFPAFFAKKEKNETATSDLRRLLRLDII